MNEPTKRFIQELRDDIARWEQRAAHLENPHISLEDSDEKPLDKAAQIARLRALVAEWRELLAKLTR